MATIKRNKVDIAIEKMKNKQYDDMTKQIETHMRTTLNGISDHPSSSRSHCIFKVHDKLRQLNQNAYTPEFVSIGAIHNSSAQEGTQKHKLRYMKELFTNRDNSDLRKCVESLRAIETQVRECYSEKPAGTDSDFVEMMLIDGSFIIQLFLKVDKFFEEQDKSKEDDAFLSRNLGTIARDMVLLENQLPMIILDKLYDILIMPASSSTSSLSSVTEHALRFFQRTQLIVPEGYISLIRKDVGYYKDSKHLLDLFGKAILPEDNDTKILVTNDLATSTKITSILISIPCVTELRLAGVKFRKVTSSEVGSLLDIQFRNATLFIPCLTITDQTETVFRNLIAYENLSHGNVSKITSYAFIMDRLIDSSNDIHFLCKQGIINNCLGNDEVASDLFNKLCSEVTMGKFCYTDICEKVNKHYDASFNVWKADFKRTYCQNPWTLFSALAAILLLLLTITQTTTSIIPLVLSKNDNSTSSNG